MGLNGSNVTVTDFWKLSQGHVAHCSQAECPCTEETALLKYLEFSCDFYSYKNLVILESHLETKQFNLFPSKILAAAFCKRWCFQFKVYFQS